MSRRLGGRRLRFLPLRQSCCSIGFKVLLLLEDRLVFDDEI